MARRVQLWEVSGTRQDGDYFEWYFTTKVEARVNMKDPEVVADAALSRVDVKLPTNREELALLLSSDDHGILQREEVETWEEPD